ncbi:hypothetical protein [Pengzhenrongella sicca]|uniref:Uncharacterized protein n=1 Tax=Pengzhenrongella sicca TaxID=2819238 RepID=A0A8A4ZEG5_9MICO|nr:hypothetical protein [Pengzhenrongella sicca]QTE29801.1 hypothetical protein J4E96_01825 [Pengzhenrongella sicca]
MNRTLAVARIHLMDHATVFVLPWAVLASALVINLIVWALLPEAAANGTGGLASLYCFSWAMISVLISRGFPFQLGLGVTRRDFLRGTFLFLGAFAVSSAVILLGLNLLERATGGFGLGGRFFRVPWLTDVPDWQLLAIYALPMVFFVGLGLAFAAVWSRYRATGVVALLIGLGFALVVPIAVIAWSDSWPSVGTWFADLVPLTAVALLAGIGALGGAGAWLALRRAPV